MSTKEMTKVSNVRLKPVEQVSLSYALKNGGPLVWLSCLIMGFGNLMAGQVIKAR